jgi:hypothetical protein
MSISTARGRLTLEVTSPVIRATTVFYSCFADIYHLSCTVSTLLALFLLPKMVERRFRPLGGRVRPEVTSPIDSLTPFWYRSVLEVCVYLSDQKLFDFFDLHVKCPLKIRGKGYSPEKICSLMRPPKGTSLSQSTSFEA